MHIDFQPLSMMDLRSRPGEVLDDVAVRGRAYVVERSGQQKACLVPISVFLPDISPNRISQELDGLAAESEPFRVSVTESREIQLILTEPGQEKDIRLCITLPHGYPNKSPVVTADPIDPSSPHLWLDGSLCIFGAMETWNPGRHDVVHTLKLCRRWLSGYALWSTTGNWPEREGT